MTYVNLIPRVLSLLRERGPWERGWMLLLQGNQSGNDFDAIAMPYSS